MTALFSTRLAKEQAAPGAAAGAPVRDLGGIAVAALTHGAALAQLSAALSGSGHLKLAFCNANLVNLASSDDGLRHALAGFLVLPDGIGVDIGSSLLYGAPFPANLNGTDFTPALLAAERRPLSVALLGGRPGIAGRAAEQLAEDYPWHRFSVLSHGYFAPEDESALLARLEASRPDLLLVAFGNPLQERWIAEKLGAQHCAVAAGVGALFDFLAGEVSRAPRGWRALRLEWLYRMTREPGRLWRRYVFGNPAFLLRILGQRLVAGRSVQ